MWLDVWERGAGRAVMECSENVKKAEVNMEEKEASVSMEISEPLQIVYTRARQEMGFPVLGKCRFFF